MQPLRLILVDPVAELCSEWERHFEKLPNVKIVNGRFEALPEFDCMVSAANSFGLMDGGVDLAIIRFFGPELMDRVQERILADFLGEQPVGTSFIIETGHPKHPFLAHTPTMRVPMAITRTDNIYQAMWAMLLAVHQHNLSGAQAIQVVACPPVPPVPSPAESDAQAIRVVACPGLGTLTGRVPAGEAARQMATAYRNYLAPPKRISWPYAEERQSSIGFGGDPEGLRQ